MSHFNVRVYGLLFSGDRLLVSDEYIRGAFYTKLPGGGLERGEGTRECLRREFKEETGLDVAIGEHLYTTDFYQQSAFNPEDQIISVYYYVHAADMSGLKVQDRPFNFHPETRLGPASEAEVFRWIGLKDLTASSMSLPIDQKVITLLLENKATKADPNAHVAEPSVNYLIQRHPFKVPVPGGKLIEEHFGLASTGHGQMSIAHMVAPAGWGEPHQSPEFDEWTLVVSGKKAIEIDGETVILSAGESLLIYKGARIRYSNPFSEPCDYWSVCLPAFSPDRVHREP